MTTVEAATVEQVVAAVNAGHVMAGMPLTEADEAMVRRIASGESSVEHEVAAARRKALAKAKASRQHSA